MISIIDKYCQDGDFFGDFYHLYPKYNSAKRAYVKIEDSNIHVPVYIDDNDDIHVGYQYHNDWEFNRNMIENPGIKIECVTNGKNVSYHFQERYYPYRNILEFHGKPDPISNGIIHDIRIKIKVSYQDQVQFGNISISSPEWSEDIELKNDNLIVKINVFGYINVRILPFSNLDTLLGLAKHCNPTNEMIIEGWNEFLKSHSPQLDDKGIKKKLSNKVIKEKLEQLKPVYKNFIYWLSSSKTRDKAKNNQLLSKFFDRVLEKDLDIEGVLVPCMVEGLKTFNLYKWSSYYTDTTTRHFCKILPGAKEELQVAAEKLDWTRRKNVLSRIDGLGISDTEYPLLFEALRNENIPTNIFVSVQKDSINQEFELWEQALRNENWRKPIFQISKNAATRTTYERIVTPYLLFCLKILPLYLDKHAPHAYLKWKCIPRYVSSTWDLEMKEDENGTTKRRSAFTPVVDMETYTVTVPYVGLSVGGVRTQWCYSLHYHLFKEGFIDPVSKQIVVDELKKSLNGRDDYGLMFYTLTGTSTATGYPTFLIIFERRLKKTVVHFHRVHPSRTTDGKRTPANKLIERCYKHMAGNIEASEIYAQQGDLIFIESKNPFDTKAKIGDIYFGTEIEFESHLMKSSEQLMLCKSEAKTPKNRLGFLNVEVPGSVTHPEHEDFDLKPGWYEIRRCRSWEANPVEITVLTID